METNYKLINEQLKSLIEDVNDDISNLSNASALLFDELADINWAGFYIVRDGALHLGPFQGKVACTKIEFGKGVCGTCYKLEKTIIVKNVHEFEGHIACDSRSNSEIVVPIFKNSNLYGLLDIDSISFNRFNEKDQTGLEEFCQILGASLL